MNTMKLLVQGLLWTTMARQGFSFAAPTSGKSLGCPNLLQDAITKNLSNAVIADAIKQCSNSIDTPKRLSKYTPLHLAAIKGNAEVIDLLANAGANLNMKDAQGHTPLLHAAWNGHVAAVKTLKTRGADTTVRSKFGGTYMDYLRMNEPFRKEKIAMDSTLFSAFKNETHTVEPQCLQKGVKFTYEHVSLPRQLSNMMTEGRHSSLDVYKEHPMALHQYTLENYIKFKEAPPRLSIKTVTHDDNGKAVEIDMCGLYAVDFIPQGAIIAEYTGEILSTHPGNIHSKYLWDEYPIINANEYRSAASMANDDFPNANIEHFAEDEGCAKGLDGMPIRKLMIALQDIQPNEQIIIDYGPRDKSRNSGIPLRPKALIEFLQSGWKDKIKAINQFDKPASIAEKLEASRVFYQWGYLLSSPRYLDFIVHMKYFKKSDIKIFEKAMRNPEMPEYSRGILNLFINEMKPRLNAKQEL